MFYLDLTHCWKKSYGNGVGKPMTICNDNEDKSGLLCYPKCQGGYVGVGPVKAIISNLKLKTNRNKTLLTLT